MAELSLDEALDALNAARTFLNPDALYIFICGDNEAVGVEWIPDVPDGLLSGYIATVEAAADVVTGAMDEFFLTEDHRGRWTLVPFI
ncbi:hypothetical protein P775_11240 [Puniceibacterium antarcticum]|uniref:Uncharacterized protein n=1 Tax=Puniceibacterium antarcticum TaxID=1206336 RepID=A0A2G8RGL5_9RHOB|nr:hypothetical protein [Puniceibacterium antarcticum]PIL20228.1 hypothetical protein P775_11240 [Puniceibacterium antarcticum]